jgi:hypothetical protein
MFRMIPGKSLHVQKKSLAMKPTAGYDSHSSANFLEWYNFSLCYALRLSRFADCGLRVWRWRSSRFVFDEAMCCPAYILTVKAFVNRRTDADDEVFKG